MRNRIRWQPLAVIFALGCSATGATKADPGQTRSPDAVSEVIEPHHRTERLRMAVLPLANDSDQSGLDRAGGSLAEVASSELVAKPGITLVERRRLNDILSELKLGSSGVVDEATAAKVGRLVGADFMAFGSFSDLGGRWLLTMRMVRVETGEIVNAVVQRGSRPEDLDGMARAAIRGVLPAAGAAAAEASPAARDELADGLPAAVRARPGALGVVVSVRDYKNKDVPRAEFARADARLMKRYLTRSLGYSEDNIIELDDPTKAEMETVFGGAGDPHGRLSRLLDLRGRGSSEVFVYYSGHGAPSVKTGRSYLVPADANPDYVELNGYPRDVLLKNLSALGARRVTVVLESCFSGGSGGGALIHDASPLVLRAAESDVPSGVNLITASSGGQISSWYPEKGHSLFTYFLIRDLSRRSAAQSWPETARNVATEVSAQAAKKYNRDQVPEFSGGGEGLLAR